ncbi:hypothetical protein EV175_006896 [Coemansia sp. RSA 1933]|nr:hypothetical protein EV175_006896 [Coemansia sp. RSA 1933]
MGAAASSAVYPRRHTETQDMRGYAQGSSDTGSTYVLPRILGNGSPLLDGYDFDPRTSTYYPQASIHDHMAYGKVQRRGSSRRSNNEYDQDDELVAADGNSPRRSRSLRNTITSLRRRLSRSSRNGAAANSSTDITPSSAMDDAVATASVH